jgi:hypothetical protein
MNNRLQREIAAHTGNGDPNAQYRADLLKASLTGDTATIRRAARVELSVWALFTAYEDARARWFAYGHDADADALIDAETALTETIDATPDVDLSEYDPRA